jgi:protein-serine/threonine kinase
MQDNPANYFMRALSDIDLPLPVGESTPPVSPLEETPGHSTRPSRSISWTKLTEQIKGKSRSSTRSSRGPSVDKKDISHPILDYNSPLCPPAPKESRAASPSPPLLSFPTAQSSPGGSISESIPVAWRHSHSASDPTNRQSPPKDPPSFEFTPPTIRLAPSFGSVGTDTSLEDIAESPFEYDRLIEPLKLDKLDFWLCSMEPARLQPPATGGTKFRAIQQAKDMEELVAERAKRSGDEPPPYDFFELIGKGAYGRVFKGKSRNHGGLVAIKIIDIDKVDYEEMTTKNLSDTIKEIEILQQLKDSKARPYVNLLEEARTVHNDLWIVSEYASGGSVNTLMKPTMMIKDPGPGLPEKFIIPIARELALGLKYVHEAGVIHRDIKSNNVLILEDGSVQLCDFGVSNILEPQKSKRTTIVGTPYWMAPELQKEWVKDADPRSLVQPKEIRYGNEVDIWAYGCTIYEMACGFPPHHTTVQWDLPTAGAPQLEGDRFSQELKDFLAFVLQPEANDRPTPDQMLEHPYLAGSTKLFPTFTLVKLVEEYYSWEQMGGARASLFNPYGAQAPDPLAPEGEDEDDDWSFSTSEEFEFDHAQFGDPFAEGKFNGMTVPPVEDMGRYEQLQAKFKEESIVRGQKRLNKLFDTSTTPYRYSAIDVDESPSGRPPSDLALREFNPGAPNRETVIDLDFSLPSVDDAPNIDLGEVPTIRANRMRSILREMAEEEENEAAFRDEATFDNDLTAKRETREWKFPAAEEDQPDNRKTMEWSFPSEQPQTNRKTMEWSFAAEQPNRKTMEWSFAAAQPPKPNRRTVEWTFDAAMAENTYEQPPKRTSRRRETKEWTFPKPDDSRASQDLSFPSRSPSLNGHGSSSRPTLRHSATMSTDDIPRSPSSPSAPP